MSAGGDRLRFAGGKATLHCSDDADPAPLLSEREKAQIGAEAAAERAGLPPGLALGFVLNGRDCAEIVQLARSLDEQAGQLHAALGLEYPVTPEVWKVAVAHVVLQLMKDVHDGRPAQDGPLIGELVWDGMQKMRDAIARHKRGDGDAD